MLDNTQVNEITDITAIILDCMDSMRSVHPALEGVVNDATARAVPVFLQSVGLRMRDTQPALAKRVFQAAKDAQLVIDGGETQYEYTDF